MRRIPARHSLITQAADILREELKTGGEFLPSERFLADQLKVSRPTLRAALAMLRRAKLIRVIPGQGSRIVHQPQAGATNHSSKIVGILSTEPTHLLPSTEIFVIGELRRHLHQLGYQLEVFVDGRLRWRRPQSILKNLVRQHPVCGWLLETQRLPVQRWFADQRLPSIVLGTCYENIHLSSIDVDFRAVTRHATGLLLRLGHRRIILLIRQSGLAGDMESERGFLEAFQSTAHAGVLPSVVYHNQTVEIIQDRLNSLFYSKNLPTAIIVSHSHDALTTLTCLTRMGFRIPKDVSLISRDDADFLAHVVPAMTRYIFNWGNFSRKVFRMITQITSTGQLTSQNVRMMPQFFKGETLAHLIEHDQAVL